MKQTDAHVIAIGIGNNLNIAELNVIADQPLTQFRFLVSSFSLLNTIAPLVKKQMFCAPRKFTSEVIFIYFMTVAFLENLPKIPPFHNPCGGAVAPPQELWRGYRLSVHALYTISC